MVVTGTAAGGTRKRLKLVPTVVRRTQQRAFLLCSCECILLLHIDVTREVLGDDDTSVFQHHSTPFHPTSKQTLRFILYSFTLALILIITFGLDYYTHINRINSLRLKYI